MPNIQFTNIKENNQSNFSEKQDRIFRNMSADEKIKLTSDFSLFISSLQTLRKQNGFSKMNLRRRIAKKIAGEKVYFISPEDLIISKLKWYQKTPSDRQIEDIQSVLKISGKNLDKKYLELWIKKLNLDEIWTAQVLKK